MEERTAKTANATSHPKKLKCQHKKKNTSEASPVDGGVDIPGEDGNQARLSSRQAPA
jgi:hypothetical protein